MRKGFVIMGLAAVLGIGGALGVCAATKKIIKIEDGKRIEIDVEQSREEAEAKAGQEAASEAAAESAVAEEPTAAELPTVPVVMETASVDPTAFEPTATEPADLEYGGMDPDLDAAFSVSHPVTGDDADGTSADGLPDASLEPVKVWGNVLEKLENGFVINNQNQAGYWGEMVIHIDKENTLVIDSITGFPAEESAIAKDRILYAYISPMMTMSLPPQTTAELVLVNVAQDAGVPLYVTAASDLAADGAGAYVLKSVGGEEIKVPADCPITPYLTRQMVRLEDITAGRKCLVWLGADSRARKIVLFNE